MSFKNLLLATTITFIPIITHANLDVYNFTDKVSTVRIASTGICTGNVPGHHYTDPANGATPGFSSTKPLDVRVLCAGSNPCSATMYSSLHCDAGTEVAVVSVNTTNLNVVINNPINPAFSVTKGGDSTLYVKNAG